METRIDEDYTLWVKAGIYTIFIAQAIGGSISLVFTIITKEIVSPEFYLMFHGILTLVPILVLIIGLLITWVAKKAHK